MRRFTEDEILKMKSMREQEHMSYRKIAAALSRSVYGVYRIMSGKRYYKVKADEDVAGGDDNIGGSDERSASL